MKILARFLLIICSWAGTAHADEVVVYTSLDQVFSEPVLQAFERRTGIKVKAVYDVEASKTTGLVNRLIAEKSHPNADVFWNSEIGRTLILKRMGVLSPYVSPSSTAIPARFKDVDGYWTGFAARARVLIVNTQLVDNSETPKSIFDLTQSKWHGKVVMGYPLFGTTSTHVAALFALLGEDKAKNYLSDMYKNGVQIVDGNSVSRDMVVAGSEAIGFTDTDDVYSAIKAKKNVAMVYPDQDGIGSLLIPNTVSLISNAPHLDAGRQLIDYLLSEEVESALAFSESMQIPLREHVKKPEYVPSLSSLHTMNLDYQSIADRMESAFIFSRQLFSR
ncbi:extracellular solute-binding protein [Methylomonas methanica]|uniref:Extracellular solute-binding protein family 1 n=1 Tax=Methylomonas methanica (strain DSM 25384 / MC09) TaxID=857087 RepID=G0A192_METMM|nr:extracellular solute-binding protein [Methylomonas methanica]AEG02512.1 extracellular solute-binding protein family 1 [Methylomonas methanica MC09]